MLLHCNSCNILWSSPAAVARTICSAPLFRTQALVPGTIRRQRQPVTADLIAFGGEVGDRQSPTQPERNNADLLLGLWREGDTHRRH